MIARHLQARWDDARRRLAVEARRGAVVALSGGVDSTLALRLAVDVLGAGRVLAATGVSASLPDEELQLSADLAGVLGVPWAGIRTTETRDPHYRRNDRDRCFVCKNTLYAALRVLADSVGHDAIVNGVIAGDDDGTRPGVRAGRERGVLMPLLDAGIDKPAVRALAKHFGLPNHDKPAGPCLASRVPFGVPITLESLDRVGRAERLLRSLGFAECRVRHHPTLARIEVPPDDLSRLCAEPLRSRVVAELRRLGFTYVSLDLGGLRSGSAHEALPGSP